MPIQSEALAEPYRRGLRDENGEPILDERGLPILAENEREFFRAVFEVVAFPRLGGSVAARSRLAAEVDSYPRVSTTVAARPALDAEIVAFPRLSARVTAASG